MLDHVSITVSDFTAAERFYDAIMKTLDVVKVGRSDDWLGYGERAAPTIRTASTSPSTRVRNRTKPSAGIGASRRNHERGRRVLARGHRRRRHRRRATRPAPLPRLLLRRLPARSRRQQGRGGVPPRAVAEARSVARMSAATSGAFGSLVGARIHKFRAVGGRATDYPLRRGTSRAIVPGIEISASARDG